MRVLLLLIVACSTGYCGYLFGEHDARTLCRRTIQHRMVLSRESAEQLLDAEARLWGGP
jgi:hypothetical protein